MPGQPAAFMSYATFDDRHDNRRLTQFRERLSAEVRVQTGEEFPIFQDRNDIAWGQSWQKRIDQTLDAVTLLLVIITPGFFRSRACRAEVERFLARERELGRDDLILPVYYVSTPELEDETRRQADELACVLASRQYADWRELRFKPFTSSVVQRAIAQLASRMRDSFWRLPAGKSADRGDAGSSAGPVAEADRGDAGSSAGPVARFVLGFKALFLIGSRRSPSAIVVRIAYYISLAWGAAWTATGISETISHFSVGYLIGAIVLILVIGVSIPLGLYKLATRLDRRA